MSAIDFVTAQDWIGASLTAPICGWSLPVTHCMYWDFPEAGKAALLASLLHGVAEQQLRLR